jgi:hypothetical protein
MQPGVFDAKVPVTPSDFNEGLFRVEIDVLSSLRKEKPPLVSPSYTAWHDLCLDD